VVNRHSIAFAIAEHAQRAGAEVLLTSFGRVRRLTERAAQRLPRTPEVLELDVNREEDFTSLREEISSRWGRLDGAVHAIAFAPEDAIGGRFLQTPRESASTAFETSAFSLKALAEALLPLYRAPDGEPGGSMVALDFDASVAWPVYDWMGVSKAALEAVGRYLARDLGEHGVRVNLISAGPLETVAASGIPGFRTLAEGWSAQAPMGWDSGDPTPVAQAALFLLSDLSSRISGEILHVDGGYHAMGAPLAGREASGSENGRPPVESAPTPRGSPRPAPG
jgi:enoyl-[acyl-carrier protein] reductase I